MGDKSEHFVCHICGSQLKHNGLLQQHIKLKHSGVSFNCDVCKKSYKAKWMLRRHMLIHLGQEPYACQYCSRKFVRFQPFKKHVTTHIGEKNFKCELCNMRFTLKQQVQRHVRTVHENPNLRKYVCSECGAAFKHLNNLNRHSNIHLPQKPFVCQFCGKQCTQQSNLKIHIMGVHKDLSHLVYEKKPTNIDPSAIVIPKYEDFKSFDERLNAKAKKEVDTRPKRKYVKSNKFSKKGKKVIEAKPVAESLNIFNWDDRSSSPLTTDNVHIDTEFKETIRDDLCNETGKDQKKSEFKIDSDKVEVPIEWDDNDESKRDVKSSNLDVTIKKEPEPEDVESSIINNELYPTTQIDFVDVKMENSKEIEIDFIKKEEDYREMEDVCSEMEDDCSKTESKKVKVCKTVQKKSRKTKNETRKKPVRKEKVSNKTETCDDENVDSTITTDVTIEPVRKRRGKYKKKDKNNPTVNHRLSLRILPCNYCHEQYDRYHMYQHLRTAHKTCRRCERVFDTIDDLDKHAATFCCRFCEETFPSLSASAKHRVDFHGVLRTDDVVECVCKFCGKKISCKSNLRKHIKAMHSTRMYACHECPKAFADESMLKLHISKHTGQEPFKCEFCSKKFIFFQNWKRHLKNHMNIKSFMCHICSKQFQNNGSLTDHIKCVHINNKKYKCTVCGAAFARNHRLTVHKRIHLAVKPYKCQFCGKECTQASNLKIHIMGVHRDVSHLVYQKAEEIKQVPPDSVFIPSGPKEYFRVHPENNTLFSKDSTNEKDSHDGSTIPQNPQTSCEV